MKTGKNVSKPHIDYRVFSWGGGGLGSSGAVGVGCSDLGGLVVGDSTKDAT